MLRTIITIQLILLTLLLSAQDKEWTLDQCMIYAIENSPRTNRQKMQNSIYHQEYLTAIGKLLPSINANTSASFNFGRGLDAETNTYTDVNTFSNNYGIYASLTLFDGLANYTRVRMGKVNKLKGKQKLEEERDMVAYETMEAFFNVLYNQDLVKIAEEQLSDSEQKLNQVKRMEELGVKGYPDVTEIEAQYAEDAYNLTRQNNLLTIAIIQLKEKMNFPIEDELTIVAEDCVELIVKEHEDALQIYNHTKEVNPKAQGAKSDYESMRLNYKASKGSLMPTISFEAGLSTNFSRYMDGSVYESFGRQFKNKRGEYVGFTLSIPIFNGFSRTATVKRAKAQLYMTEYDRDETFRLLYREIEQAVADVNGQVDEYAQAVKQRNAAQVAHQVNLRKYDEGLIDPIILHTSANRLLKTKAEELNAKYKYYIKSRLVDYYKGQPFISK